MTDRVVAGLRCSEAEDLAAGFVLGALEPAEMTRVRAHLAGCPEPHPEFAELGAAVPALLASVPQVEPPAALRDRILAAAKADTVAAAIDAVERVPAASPAASAAEPPAARPARRDLFGFSRVWRPAWGLAGAAAVLAIVVLGSQALQLQRERDGLLEYQRGIAAVIDAAAQPGAQLAVLTSATGGAGPAGIAAVGSDGSVRLAMRGLAPTSGAQVYEAWAIAGQAPPQPIGSFTVGSTGSAALTQAQGTPSSRVVIALTLEPAAGATTPTLPIIASGAAQTQPG